jgi:hypothetical protein
MLAKMPNFLDIRMFESSPRRGACKWDCAGTAAARRRLAFSQGKR